MRRPIRLLVFVLLFAAPARAQDLSITPLVGYATGGKINGTPETVPGTLNAKASFTAGLALTWSTNDFADIEVLYAYEGSTLEFDETGVGARDISKLAIHQVHANALFSTSNFGAAVQPYFLAGAGISVFVPSDDQVESATRFSFALGLGVRRDLSDKLRLRIQGRYLPTYITSTADGVLCSPYYGCYTVGDSQFLNQFDFLAGIEITLRRQPDVQELPPR